MTSKWAWNCERCGHSSDWHSLKTGRPTDPNAKFVCNKCDCPACIPTSNDIEVK